MKLNVAIMATVKVHVDGMELSLDKAKRKIVNAVTGIPDSGQGGWAELLAVARLRRRSIHSILAEMHAISLQALIAMAFADDEPPRPSAAMTSLQSWDLQLFSSMTLPAKEALKWPDLEHISCAVSQLLLALAVLVLVHLLLPLAHDTVCPHFCQAIVCTRC